MYIEPGAPWQHGVGELLNGKLRDECLNPELFTSLTEARVVIGDFREHYNRRRPHSGLDDRTSAAIAPACRQAPPLGLATLDLASRPACTPRETWADLVTVPLI